MRNLPRLAWTVSTVGARTQPPRSHHEETLVDNRCRIPRSGAHQPGPDPRLRWPARRQESPGK
jgi:hypothetical protein